MQKLILEKTKLEQLVAEGKAEREYQGDSETGRIFTEINGEKLK